MSIVHVFASKHHRHAIYFIAKNKAERVKLQQLLEILTDKQTNIYINCFPQTNMHITFEEHMLTTTRPGLYLKINVSHLFWFILFKGDIIYIGT